MLEFIKPCGAGEIIIEDFSDNSRRVIPFKNKVVNGGRAALAKSLGNLFGGDYQYWIYSMNYGAGGTVGGVPRYVEATRAGLWGPTVASKAVLATFDADTNGITFTSVLLTTDAAGQTINEAALVMKSGDVFSQTTFGDINKTATMQITINWQMNMV